jgi:hypothetical protein
MSGNLSRWMVMQRELGTSKGLVRRPGGLRTIAQPFGLTCPLTGAVPFVLAAMKDSAECRHSP